MMIKRLAYHVIAVVGLILSTNTYAESLLEVFQQALISDPEFQQANEVRLSQLQNVPISLASLLPFIYANANDEYVVLDDNSKPLNRNLNNNNINNNQVYKYNSHRYQFNVLQPIFDYAAWASFQQAKITAKYADAVFASAVQSLISRVVRAYFNVLNAEDNLRYTEAEKRAIYRQLDQVRQQYTVGIVAITDVYQAQAQYDSILAEEIAAKNNIINNKEELRAITGIYYNQLDGLRTFIPLEKPEPVQVNQWVTTGLVRNWNLLAATYNAQIAQEEVAIQRAGHLPVVDAVGSHAGIKTGSTPGGKQRTRTSSVGISLELPIYQGGLVVAETKQARFDYQAALDAEESVRRQVIKDVHQSYNNILAGISKIKADRQAIISNEASLRSTIEGYKVGTQTMLDVLQSQQYLFDAERIYSADQYGYIYSIFDLKYAAGTLNYQDIREINGWLVHGQPSYNALRVQEIDETFGISSTNNSLGNIQGIDKTNNNVVNDLLYGNNLDEDAVDKLIPSIQSSTPTSSSFSQKKSNTSTSSPGAQATTSSNSELKSAESTPQSTDSLNTKNKASASPTVSTANRSSTPTDSASSAGND